MADSNRCQGQCHVSENRENVQFFKLKFDSSTKNLMSKHICCGAHNL